MWQHCHHRAQRSKLADIFELVPHIPQCEMTFSDPLVHVLINVCLINHIHETRNVSKSKQPTDKTLRIEGLEIRHMFSNTNEGNRRAGSRHGAEGTTSLSVTIELRDNHAPNGHARSEGFRLVLRSLADGRIHDENNVVGVDRLRHLLHFLKKSFLLFVSSRCVNNDQLKFVKFKAIHAFNRKLHWVSLRIASVERNTRLGSVLFQLVKGTSSKSVCTH
mmetsp:Transcript_11849/g.49524  ORF Transcript_11849/g.49524 Transcript_11849/m.49524 type:complete len:219 (-) Transcript_11849:487-1143(-)